MPRSMGSNKWFLECYAIVFGIKRDPIQLEPVEGDWSYEDWFRPNPSIGSLESFLGCGAPRCFFHLVLLYGRAGPVPYRLRPKKIMCSVVFPQKNQTRPGGRAGPLGLCGSKSVKDNPGPRIR